MIWRGRSLSTAAPLIGAMALVAVAATTASHSVMDFLIRFAALATFATSLNLLAGYGGMVSFGHGLFYGFGAYCFALLMQKANTSIPVALVATLAGTALTALVVGAICIRLQDVYFSFVTLAFQMLFHSIVLAASIWTGGDQGLHGGIPRPPFFGVELSKQRDLCVFCVLLFVICLLAMWSIVSSSFGATLRMVRDNSLRAAFLGVPVERVRIKVFVLASVFAAVGGVMQALFVSGAYPEFAYWTVSGEGIFVIMLGGMSTFLGPGVGALIMLLLNDVVTRFTEYQGLVVGSVILVLVLGFRRGVLDVFVGRFVGPPKSGASKRGT